MTTTLDDLRAFAVTRSLFPPTTLVRALTRLGFVQADPIRAPARAQDLTLRQRVKGYRAGDLERRYPSLAVEEDFFINYGFLPRPIQELMQPRGLGGWSASRRRRAQELLEFVRAHGIVHPRAVDEHFAHGTVVNYWGGASSATTHLLDAMHYGGMLRVAGREAGIRLYAVHDYPPCPRDREGKRARVDALVDVLVGKYAPLPAASLSALVARLRYAIPQWQAELRPALARARARLAHAPVDGVEWYWPAGERPTGTSPVGAVHLLAPFDPVVWDRRRFERLWGWAYRFEAYTPQLKRKLGYYALPLLWRDQVIGWGNLAVNRGSLDASFGYVAGAPPADPSFGRALEEELEGMRRFLTARPAAGRRNS
jgi:uncharacterized protein